MLFPEQVPYRSWALAGGILAGSLGESQACTRHLRSQQGGYWEKEGVRERQIAGRAVGLCW